MDLTQYTQYMRVDTSIYRGSRFNMEIYFEQTKTLEFRTFGPALIILFHTCCNNPTGIDYLPDEWNNILEIMKSKNHIAFHRKVVES